MQLSTFANKVRGQINFVGFTKSPTLPESRWKGYIKDYNGSTMMQCVVQREIRHETIYGDIRMQRDAIIEQILQVIELKRRKGLTLSQRG